VERRQCESEWLIFLKDPLEESLTAKIRKQGNKFAYVRRLNQWIPVWRGLVITQDILGSGYDRAAELQESKEVVERLLDDGYAQLEGTVASWRRLEDSSIPMRFAKVS
jgi:hypothetical protein